MMLEHLKEQHLLEMEDLRNQLESKVRLLSATKQIREFTQSAKLLI